MLIFGRRIGKQGTASTISLSLEVPSKGREGGKIRHEARSRECHVSPAVVDTDDSAELTKRLIFGLNAL